MTFIGVVIVVIGIVYCMRMMESYEEGEEEMMMEGEEEMMEPTEEDMVMDPTEEEMEEDEEQDEIDMKMESETMLTSEVKMETKRKKEPLAELVPKSAHKEDILIRVQKYNNKPGKFLLHAEGLNIMNDGGLEYHKVV